MAKRKRREHRAAGGSGSRADLGTPELASHGDFRILELPVLGRRLQREPLHERLWRAGRLPADAYEAGEQYARDWAVAQGARDGAESAGRVDGAAWLSGYPDAVLEAVAALGAARARIGAAGVAVVEAVCCEGMSASAAAMLMSGQSHGAARRWVEGWLIDALNALCDAHAPVN